MGGLPEDRDRPSHIDLSPTLAEEKLDRTLRIAAYALERVQVGDAAEAEFLLEQVVTLDGRYVAYPRTKYRDDADDHAPPKWEGSE